MHNQRRGDNIHYRNFLPKVKTAEQIKRDEEERKAANIAYQHEVEQRKAKARAEAKANRLALSKPLFDVTLPPKSPSPPICQLGLEKDKNVDKINRNLEHMKKIIVFFEQFVTAALEKKDDLRDAQIHQISTWTTKALGPLYGQFIELEKTLKYWSKRIPTEYRNSSDLTVHMRTPYAKSIQYKGTCVGETQSIHNHIRKAIVQLSGANGETPDAGARRIIDINIIDNRPIWPFTANSYSPSITLKYFISVCKDKILKIFEYIDPVKKLPILEQQFRINKGNVLTKPMIEQIFVGQSNNIRLSNAGDLQAGSFPDQKIEKSKSTLPVISLKQQDKTGNITKNTFVTNSVLTLKIFYNQGFFLNDCRLYKLVFHIIPINDSNQSSIWINLAKIVLFSTADGEFKNISYKRKYLGNNKDKVIAEKLNVETGRFGV